MGQAPREQAAEAVGPSQAQAFIANLELGLRAAQGGQISFNRAVLTFPPPMKVDIFLREAASRRLDVYGFLAYATTAMPRGMSEPERRRASELVSSTARILLGRLEGNASETIIDGILSLSERSEHFAALAPAAQAAEFNQVIEITRSISDSLNRGSQDALRTLLTTSRLGVGAREWARSVLDIVFDRSGRIRAEIERSSGSNRAMELALNTYIGFSEQERREVSRWLEHGGSLRSDTFNKIYNLVQGDVRGTAREILRGLGMDFSIILNNTTQNMDIQNIYDINMHIGLFRSRMGMG